MHTGIRKIEPRPAPLRRKAATPRAVHEGQSFQDQQRSNRVKTRALLALFLLLVMAAGWLAGAGFERMRGSEIWEMEGWTEPFYRDYRYLMTGTALLLGVVHLMRLRRRGHWILLGLVRARPLAERRLRAVLEEMSIAALMPAPMLFLVEDPTPNAFAVGWDEKRSAVAVTRGLLELLNRDELQAVVAHEVAHIRNGDTKLLTLLVGMSQAVSILASFALGPLGAMWTMALDGAGDDETTDPEDADPAPPPAPTHEPLDVDSVKKGALLLLATPFAAVIILVVSLVVSLTLVLVFAAIFMILPLLALAWAVAEVCGFEILPDGADGPRGLRWAAFIVPVGLLLGPAILLVGIVAPLALLVLRMALSRTREFDADAGAVELTRNPVGLLGALRKLEQYRAGGDSPRWPPALRPMCICSANDPESGLRSLLSTHPPLSERIRRVEAMLSGT